MPEFKTKEEAYDLCITEGNIIPTKITLQKAKDAIQLAQEDLETAKEAIKNKRWNSGYKTHYDVLHQLTEAYLGLEEIKVKNHQCLFAYICIKHPELELDWNFFEKARTKRNGINYYATKVTETD